MAGLSDGGAGAAPFLVVDNTAPPVKLAPIYSTGHGKNMNKGNLTCSGSDEFCFLCCYCSTADCEVDLRAHIAELAEQGQEVTTISNAVRSIYKRSIQPSLLHVLEDGTEVQSPEWSVQSIRRHLLLSGEYSTIFQSYENYLLKSIIVRQAESIVEEGGTVNDEKTKLLLASVKMYSEYRAKTCPPAAKRQKTGINSGAS